jgi:hypothetical protein
MDKGILQERNYPLLTQSEDLSVSQIENRLSTVIQSVKNGEDELAKKLEKLKDTSSIEIRRNWYLTIDKSSIEEGFKTTYKDLSEGFKVCGEALIGVNDHISKILEFIVMIVKLESDIYGKLDDLETNDVEIRYFFDNLIQKSGIKDKHFAEMLEGLRSRTYTLRDRLRMLQDKINARVDDIVEKIQARIDSLENEQNRFFIEGKKELLKDVEQLKAGLVQQFEEKSKEISRCLQENQRKGEELREEMRRNINHAKDELSSSTQKCEQILAQVVAKELQIVSDYEKGYKELQNSIDTYEEQLETAIASTIERFSEIANQNEKELADKVSVATEDLRQQLDAQQAKFHEIIELHRKTARRTIIYATSLATVLGTCVSIALHFFL